MFNPSNTKELVKLILKGIKGKVKIALDLTLGNGKDTVLIKEIIAPEKIFAFDIQEEAINKSKEYLKNYGNIEYIHDSHLYFDKYIKDVNIDVAIFNLGYLPGGDHNITTDYKVVIATIDKLLLKLSENGMIILTLYPGHREGMKEKINIEEYLSKMQQRNFNILKYEFLNQKNNPPFVITIGKR